MSKSYEKPALRDVGTLQDLTEGTFNKVGTPSDAFTAITNGVVIGSLVVSP